LTSKKYPDSIKERYFMLKKILWQIIVGIIGLYLAVLFVPGTEIAGGEALSQEGVKILILAGSVLGLINFFLKPIVSLISFPLKLLTLGLFNLVINMTMLWIVDILFFDLNIIGLSGLFWTSLIIWLLSSIIPETIKEAN
jgi:putative membrane protein